MGCLGGPWRGARGLAGAGVAVRWRPRRDEVVHGRQDGAAGEPAARRAGGAGAGQGAGLPPRTNDGRSTLSLRKQFVDLSLPEHCPSFTFHHKTASEGGAWKDSVLCTKQTGACRHLNTPSAIRYAVLFLHPSE